MTILCGLLSRSQFISLPLFISTYAGDTLWALMVFWGFSIILSDWDTWKIIFISMLFSFAIEFSQFYHAPWIDNLRHTKVGGLILGFGFKLSDLACYIIGIIFGSAIDYFLLKFINITGSYKRGRRPGRTDDGGCRREAGAVKPDRMRVRRPRWRLSAGPRTGGP